MLSVFSNNLREVNLNLFLVPDPRNLIIEVETGSRIRKQVELFISKSEFFSGFWSRAGRQNWPDLDPRTLLFCSPALYIKAWMLTIKNNLPRILNYFACFMVQYDFHFIVWFIFKLSVKFWYSTDLIIIILYRVNLVKLRRGLRFTFHGAKIITFHSK